MAAADTVSRGRTATISSTPGRIIDRAFAGPDVAAVRVVCTVETYDRDHIARLPEHLLKAGISILD